MRAQIDWLSLVVALFRCASRCWLGAQKLDWPETQLECVEPSV